ncbi:cytochrome P450 [Sodiomyces alkalinus F11]|uniref:Cytochrome P450 n=1 Tax=Sodiomyces alkalinus (strain CBS 110278 / VKM F-3762 / F11) TaxID=1314773 RepID=A0A3N2PZF9_SODAK|nr:cytochrome P450 [Sodiomyces alkalinus F11]ROT39910.1 cytochrome P450 [Sodiomyces alkalinus F11]
MNAGSLTTVFALVLAGFVSIKILVAIWSEWRSPLNRVPGPWISKFTGAFWVASVIRGTAFRKAFEYSQTFGPITRVAPDHVIVSDRRSVHQVLVEIDLRKSQLYEKFRPSQEGDSLFTFLDKKLYRQRRRLLSHGFSVSYLRGLEHLLKKCVKSLEDVLDEQCRQNGGRTTMDAWNLMGCVTADIIGETAFGGSFELVKNGQHPIRQRFSESLKRGTMYQLMPFLKHLPFMPPFQDPELRRLLDEVIERRRTTEDKVPKQDLLQILLDAHDQDPKGFPLIDVVSEMLVFLIAGSDTPSGTLSFAIMFLMNHPEVYRRVVDEVREAFPEPDSEVTDERMADLPYLNAILKETLRVMNPTASGLARQTDEDLILAGHLIPAGTRVTANTLALHWDENEWPDPMKFVPERWLGEYKGMQHNEKGAWYPFAAGSRNCIGKQ